MKMRSYVFAMLVSFTLLLIIPTLFYLISKRVKESKIKKLFLKHPDYAFALRQRDYSWHRYNNHFSTVVIPLCKNLRKLNRENCRDLQYEELRKQAIRICKNHLNTEREVSDNFYQEYSRKAENVKLLEKKYGIGA